MIVAITIWVIGWIYACGSHSGDRRKIENDGFYSDKLMVANHSAYFVYFILFFMWPFYLGYH